MPGLLIYYHLIFPALKHDMTKTLEEKCVFHAFIQTQEKALGTFGHVSSEQHAIIIISLKFKTNTAYFPV